MFHERKFEFQIAARDRGAAGLGFRRLSPGHRRISLVTCRLPLVTHHPPLITALANHQSRVTSQGFLIVTLELEFPATATKPTSRPISNRYKTPFLHPGFMRGNRSGPATSDPQLLARSLQFLIANLRLEFFLSSTKSMNYNSLIANGWRFFLAWQVSSRTHPASGKFRIRRPRYRLQSEVKRWLPSLSAHTGRSNVGCVSAIEFEDSLSCCIKFKSLLCYGDSHFPPRTTVASVANGPNGED
jgi:hypothetical protein